MKVESLKIKPRAPQKRVIEQAQKEGNPIPIAREPFEIQVPVYDSSDIVTLVEQNNQKVLDFVARLLNAEVVSAIRAQLADDEQFPVDQEVDTSNFDLEAVTLNKLSEQISKTSALELEFTEEEFKEFVQDFVSFMVPQYPGNPKAEVVLLNVANALIRDFKEIRNEQEKMDQVKSILDKFATAASDSLLEKYGPMYEYFSAVYEKRTKALAKRNEKTDVFLD